MIYLNKKEFWVQDSFLLEFLYWKLFWDFSYNENVLRKNHFMKKQG